MPRYTPSGPDLATLTADTDRVIIGKLVSVSDMNGRLALLTMAAPEGEIRVLYRKIGRRGRLAEPGMQLAIWARETPPDELMQRSATRQPDGEAILFAPHPVRGIIPLQDDDVALLAEFLKQLAADDEPAALLTLLRSRNAALVEDATRLLYRLYPLESGTELPAELPDAISAALEVPGVQRLALLVWMGNTPVMHARLSPFRPRGPGELAAWLQARANTGQPAGNAELTAYTLMPDPGMRAAALQQLLQCRCRQAMPPLLRALYGGDRRLRLRAIQQSPVLGDALLPHLAAVMSERGPRLKRSAARAITRIGSDAAARTLLDLAAEADQGGQRRAAAMQAAHALYAWKGPDSEYVGQLRALPQGKQLLTHARESVLPLPDMH